jgi:hypothetical protein
MIASACVPVALPVADQSATTTGNWQAGFQQVLPVVQSQAAFAFRQLPAEARDEAIQEVVCLACQAFARLFQLGRAETVTASSLARFAILRCRGGREVAQRRNGRDVLSPYARRHQSVRVESLCVRSSETGDWCEMLIEDATVTPADLAASRIDYPAFLSTLDARRRQIAETLATGETTQRVAQMFGISPTRICQFRNEFRQAWQRFVGEASPAAA